MPTKFKAVTKTEWLAKVEKDLKGKSLNDLNFKVDGTDFSPFHHPDDQPEPPSPIPGFPDGHRMVGIQIDATNNVTLANQVALDALAKGADLLIFVVPHLDTLGKKTKKLLLAGIIREIVTIVFAERIHKYPTSPFLFQEGDRYHFDALQDGHADALFAAMESFSEEGANVPTFHVGVTNDYLVSIASLRALRLCYWRITEAFEKPMNCRIIAHVRPADNSNSNLNKIAATTQAMSAIIGGADGLIVRPSDGDEESAFSRRVGLNMQHILEYESHLHGIPDPAAGSYFLEALTDQLAKSTWSAYQALFKNPLYKL